MRLVLIVVRLVGRLVVPGLLVGSLVLAGRFIAAMPTRWAVLSTLALSVVYGLVWLVWTWRAREDGWIDGRGAGLDIGRKEGYERGKTHADADAYTRGQKWGESVGWGRGYAQGVKVKLASYTYRDEARDGDTDIDVVVAYDGTDEAAALDALASQARGEAIDSPQETEGDEK